jgi:hypothetical protein
VDHIFLLLPGNFPASLTVGSPLRTYRFGPGQRRTLRAEVAGPTSLLPQTIRFLRVPRPSISRLLEDSGAKDLAGTFVAENWSA